MGQAEAKKALTEAQERLDAANTFHEAAYKLGFYEAAKCAEDVIEALKEAVIKAEAALEAGSNG